MGADHKGSQMGRVLNCHEVEIDLDAFELRRAGRPVRLERQPMELLVLLATSEGGLVSRDEIAHLLWRDGIFVEVNQGINTAIRKLRRALRDDPDRPRFVQTVLRKGYRFLAPVTVSSRPAASPAVVEAIPRVAVLPLANLGSSPDQDYFTEGLTEALITDLAQAGGLEVISHTSVLRYKGTARPVAQIARRAAR